MSRKSGVLMHISSMFGDYSIGGFGDEAKYFIDFLNSCGFSYWQVLPFCMVDECNSPYKSYSTFGGNPFFVDLKKLNKKGLITDTELEAEQQKTPYVCEFEKLHKTRVKLLIDTSKRVIDKTEIESYIASNPYILKFCEFMALKYSNNNLPWYEWTVDSYDEDVLFGWKFIQ